MPGSNALICEAMEATVSTAPIAERRLQLGETLRRLLNADIFVSYVCDTDGPYADPVEINLGQDSLRDYDRHFRHFDSITPRLFKRHHTSMLTPKDTAPSAFVTEFLRPRDMYFGMNYFAEQPSPGSIDLRFWRGKNAEPFSASDARLLHGFGKLVTQLWPNDPDPEAVKFTPRETEVVSLLADGWSDKQICAQLGMSLATLRTHISHCFQKTGAQNRAGLAGYFIRARGDGSRAAGQ